jgi:hypothetical protein
MTTQWISRVAQACAGLLRSPVLGSYSADLAEHDADGRRVRRELDAIRNRFPDRAEWM